MSVKVLLADDHHLVRAGIRTLLEGLDEVEVVAEAGDGAEVVELVKTHAPDVALLDIEMPGVSGLDIAATLRDEYPGVAVIILSMHAYEEFVLKALRAGARGYLVKDAATAELEIAINAISRGETFLSPRVSQQVIVEYLARGKHANPGRSDLTPRQADVLRLIAGGKSNKEVAAALSVSIKTVETHRAQLMARLDIHDVPGLVRYAIRTGLVADGAAG